MTLRAVAQDLTPPILLRAIRSTRRMLRGNYRGKAIPSSAVGDQDLDLYWDPRMALILDQWGEGTVWNEIKFLLANCSGKVLDIACGTGKTITINAHNNELELYGCDISDLLIGKAIGRGIPAARLKVCDATETDYLDDEFDYAYSIGSLEHFSYHGIDRFVSESRRIVRHSSFHMIPVSRSAEDEGWLKTTQSFHNNSVDWWKKKFESAFSKVQVLDSSWNDEISIGAWFVCSKAK